MPQNNTSSQTAPNHTHKKEKVTHMVVNGIGEFPIIVEDKPTPLPSLQKKRSMRFRGTCVHGDKTSLTRTVDFWGLRCSK